MSVDLDRIGHYRITHELGRGGMGVVYAASDERLNRSVAIKMIRDTGGDDAARERFWREARAAAAVNHPNVCQLYEIAEDEGQLYIAMELLDGESLAARLERGPVAVAEALTMMLATLSALEALHERGIVHRDLKPSNVFLTKFGVKLLDFGLARPEVSDQLDTAQDLTLPGKVVGTPAYMAPEQLSGHPVDARSDLFAAGAVFYEMLTGKSPFAGDSMVATMHAVLNDRPPALTGSSSIDAIDQIIQTALAKRPADRYQSAREMADDVRVAMVTSDPSGETPVARALTRLIALPFRVLRPDPETDFLAFGLADAITSSLSNLDSLVVRSSLAAAQFSNEVPDLKKIASETDVDVVLTGTLLRAGEQIRVNAQLLEAPGGTVLWSRGVQSALGDVFELQDDFTQRIVESLSIPLTRREEQLLKRDVPATARAYEFYLRGNECASRRDQWVVARDLYEQSVAEDPQFAPAWAQLGRMRRLVGVYFDTEHVEEHMRKAEEASQRALALNPDLPLAHNLYAYVEVDLGRAKEAMLRLLDCASRQRADPELFAGLVHACRYCGLIEASIAAYEKASRLDPNIRTSVCHSYWFAGDTERALATDNGETPFMKLLVRIRRGEIDQVIEELQELATTKPSSYTRGWQLLVAALQQNRAVLDAQYDLEAAELRDPEGIYYWALIAAYAGDVDRTLQMLRRAVDRGWLCYQALASEPWLDGVRADERFSRILRDAEAQHREAAAAFLSAGGDRLLGVRGVA